MGPSARYFAILLALLIIATVVLPAAGATTATPTPRPTPTRPPQLCVITGMVVDPNDKGVSGANVSLYNAKLQNSRYVKTTLASVEQNPQTTGAGGGSGIAGLYQFMNVPSGLYIIQVDLGGTTYTSGGVQATEGTVQIADIQVKATPSPTPAPVATATPTAQPSVSPTSQPTPTDQPTPTPAGQPPSAHPSLLRDLIAVIVGLQLIACVFVLWLYATKRL